MPRPLLLGTQLVLRSTIHSSETQPLGPMLHQHERQAIQTRHELLAMRAPMYVHLEDPNFVFQNIALLQSMKKCFVHIDHRAFEAHGIGFSLKLLKGAKLRVLPTNPLVPVKTRRVHAKKRACILRFRVRAGLLTNCIRQGTMVNSSTIRLAISLFASLYCVASPTCFPCSCKACSYMSCLLGCEQFLTSTLKLHGHRGWNNVWVVCWDLNFYP
mmetsp:Transcript_61709/g.201375  ORF Transcript_61709/g.201375 Transcript_61709/m.201375 type:complete len:214 (+) Transcript_61709:1607-2248(+)